jgi:enediyne biosynthesis protein E4
LVTALLALLWIVFLFLYQPPYDTTAHVYSEAKVPEHLRHAVTFHDVASSWGIAYHNGSIKNSQVPVAAISTIAPSVSVVDINEDGLMDIFIAAQPNLLFINDGHHSFHEAAQEYGISSPHDRAFNSFGLFADFNGDGHIDLLLTRYPCHRLFYGQGPRKPFIDKSDYLNSYCSNPEAVNVFDFNGDGRLDLVFGNLLGKPSEKPPSFPYWFSAPRYDNQTGAQSDLLLQDKDGKFIWKKDAAFNGRPYAHAVGISDINEDGRPDLFIANDYSTDQMYLNIDGKNIKEVTNDWIPRRMHGLTGMNAEFADVNGDGHIDLFVSNAFKPPFLKSINLLWIKKSDISAFENKSVDLGVDRCGFAWGAKFADFNNDGLLDLAVTNGRDRGYKIKKEGEGNSFWFERTVISQIPWFLRKDYANDDVLTQGRFSNFYTSAFERDCLFIRDIDGKFYDLAPYLEIGQDKQEGRGLALVDADNDGKVDFLVTNLLGDLRYWHNETSEVGSWIGFTLIDRKDNRIPHGSFLRLVRENAADLVYEYYPANGYRAQSDPRVHFGLGKNDKLKYLEVRWPNGKITRHDQLLANQYQDIRQSVR